jgi:hypothetical protein
MSGITYFCTDQHGNVYQRYSAGHIQPRYFFAVVSRGLGTTLPVGKANVAYTSRRDLANKALTQCHNWRGQWEAEVVQVRSYRGRYKVEPITIVDEQRDLLPFWAAVNAQLAARGQPEALFADIRVLAELFDDAVTAACHEISVRRQAVIDDYREAEVADAQQGRGE